MNPIEQICKQLRKMGFKNEIFKTLQDVMDRLCDTINDLTKKNGKKYHIKRLDRTYKNTTIPKRN